MLKVTVSLPEGAAERLLKRWREEPEVRAQLEAVGITEIQLTKLVDDGTDDCCDQEPSSEK